MSDTFYPPLTAEQFNEGAGYTFRGVPIVEDENAEYVFAYGHVDPALFAEVVNDLDRENLEHDPDEPYTADDVEHHWALTTQPADHPDGWAATWGRRPEGAWGTFPVTVVSR